MNTFGIINRINHFFLGNIVIYEALGQVILPLGLSALGQYHLPSGFINHNIAQKEVFYSVNISWIPDFISTDINLRVKIPYDRGSETQLSIIHMLI